MLAKEIHFIPLNFTLTMQASIICVPTSATKLNWVSCSGMYNDVLNVSPRKVSTRNKFVVLVFGSLSTGVLMGTMNGWGREASTCSRANAPGIHN